MTVPFPHPGFMRKVYPGFLQLSGFMAMNFDRHVTAHQEFYHHLVDGDGDSGREAPRVLRRISGGDGPDRRVLSADGRDGVRQAPAAERTDDASRPAGPAPRRSGDTALLTVEGERDDISGVGQTKAAHALCTNLPYEMQAALSRAWASAITASSTARASAPRSSRASPTSSASTASRRTAAASGAARRARADCRIPARETRSGSRLSGPSPSPMATFSLAEKRRGFAHVAFFLNAFPLPMSFSS